MSFKDADYTRRLSENYRNRLGWPEEIAIAAAQVAADVLRTEYGGGSIYVGARNIDRERIKEDFDGRNVAELARRHGVSARTVRRIVSR